jgi:hypothetical protein
MFSCKSNFSRYIIIFFTLVSFFFVLGGCKNLFGKKDSEADEMPAKQTAKQEKKAAKKTEKSEKKPARKSKKEAAEQTEEEPISAEAPAETFPDDGYIRLVINESKGCFSLYYLTDPQKMRYEPLFNPNDSSASFLSVIVDGEVYKLGSSNQFKSRIEREKKDMALIFESPFLKVTQLFSPVRTTSSKMANGVKITISVKNTGTERSFVGVKMLLDTDLGERRGGTPILTNTQVVKSELLIDGHSSERYWISRGKKISLMGSIVNPVRTYGKSPDYVHIANWRRLRDASWMLPYSQGRSFNNLPNSVGDAAVCYYFGPQMIERNRIVTYTVFLTTEDPAWYNRAEQPIIDNLTPAIVSDTVSKPAAVAAAVAAQPKTQTKREELIINIPAIEAQAQKEAAVTGENADAIVLIKLQEILNQFVDGKIFLKENDLLEIDRTIEKYRIRN